MDLRPDGTRAVLLTYKHACLFYREENGARDAVLRRKCNVLNLPLSGAAKDLRPREAVCFGADGRSVMVTSEGVGAGIYSLDSE